MIQHQKELLEMLELPETPIDQQVYTGIRTENQTGNSKLLWRNSELWGTLLIVGNLDSHSELTPIRTVLN
jgi:hypothetical protein